MDVALDVRGASDDKVFALHQNQPNPFNTSTQIGFTLPEAMTATLTIYDVAGKMLKIIEVDGVKGYNEVGVKENRTEWSRCTVLSAGC